MALSQKHEGKTVVPWFNTNEWIFVYNSLFSEDDKIKNSKRALEMLQLWKARMPYIPSGVEGTYEILQVNIEHPVESTLISERNLQILYCSAIMRFLNVCIPSKQGSFYESAKAMNIPDWLISLRHEAAHSTQLPSLELISRACTCAMKWLRDEYWDPLVITMSDCCASSVENVNAADQPILLMQLLECMIICQYTGIHQLNDVPNIQEMIKDFPAKIKSTTTINVAINTLLNELSSFSSHQIVCCLLAGDTFLCEELNETFNFFKSKRLPWPFVKLWETVLSTLDITSVLVTELVNVTIDDKQSNLRRHLASLWLKEIAKSLKKLMIVKDEMEINSNNKNVENVVTDIVTSVNKIHPELQEVIDLDYMNDIPYYILNIKYLDEYILKTPTQFTNLFLPDYLKIIKPSIPVNTQQSILNLVDAATGLSNTSEGNPNRIYSTKDLLTVCDDIILIDLEEGPWQKASDKIDFTRTPLGVLPWQLTDFNPTLQILNNK